MKSKTLFAAAVVVASLFADAGVLGEYFRNLPEGTDPATISRRITDQFLSSRPENYRPAGYHGNEGYGWNRHVQYSVISLWVNAIECARLAGDKVREEKLVRLFDDFLPGGQKNRCCSRPYHVDDTIFGALPYEIFLGNKDPRCLEMGNFYADTQWTPPCEGTLKERHMPPKEVQEGFWAKGYTPQTRLWIDDMYMITVLQSQATRATGDRKYIDRAAREMCLYLDELQLKEGPAAGLFYHAPDVKYVWGRGDGWMAAGMALVLDRVPADSPYRARILEGYHAMMASLLRYQRSDGLWSQLVDRPDDPRNWAETSCTAMFAYAFVTGVERGWLDARTYGPAARRAYDALCRRFDAIGNISDVCVGTGKKDDLQYYFDRPRVNGDPHGQAPMLWIASVLLEAGAGKIEGLHTPATSKLFEKRIDPVSGVVSWALSGGVLKNRQSIYFTCKSMTADGRFLLVDVSKNERRNAVDAKGRSLKKVPDNRKHKALVDFLKDELIDLPEVNGQIPFVDVKDDYMVYYRDRTFYRRDFRAPLVERRLCDFPSELMKDGAKVGSPFTHLTLTKDRKKAFLESRILQADGATNYVQGTVELATGAYESWGRTDFFCNHGQINPADDRLALCAWEECWLAEGKAYQAKTGWYPRMWLVHPDGRRELVPARAKKGASHEIWDDDGQGFSWCGGGVWHQSLADLASGKQECYCPDPKARHNMLSADKRYVVYDVAPAKWWRGCTWNVKFHNRETGRTVEVYSTRPALMPEKNESRLHPDPHPHFSGDGKWVVSTANGARGNMEVYLTAVDQLVERTTMPVPEGRRVVVSNPIGVHRPAETVTLNWADFGIREGDTATRVWDVKEDRPVAWQDVKKGQFVFSTALAPDETREFVVCTNAALPQADLSIVCWSQHLPERMDDFAWENDRFGARAYGPVIMEPAPKGQKLVSSGIDIINKCVPYPVLHRWFVERTGEGSYHKDHGEGMDNYKVGPSRGCGGLGALAADGTWCNSINWKKGRTFMNGPVRTVFEIVYPAWGGLGEERRTVTLDRGQFFAHHVARFAAKAPEGVRVGPGLDCAPERRHDGRIGQDLAQGWIANWEPDGVDGPDTGSIATAVVLDPSMGTATVATDALGCVHLFPSGRRTQIGYWAGATWSGAGAVKDAKAWHALVRDFAAALRNPPKVSLR